METTYERLSSLNVNEHIEKKNGLSYLSWAWALDQLLRLDPGASWTYGEPKHYADTLMVFCTVSSFGRERTAQLPVMDHKNRAIMNPDAFQVNTAMQRALVKAIALHGLGLYIYAGEDLPEGATDTQQPAQPAAASITATQVKQIEALLTETDTALSRVLAFFRVDALAQIPATEYERVIKTLERSKRRAA
ncbi:MAG: DUF1071 domain-containing protein [Proteobacteria bacterium]|nr:DUF1071 domain-containing protein [Pseudomonadota bacterium]